MAFASYFLGYVTVFKHTVWTITYIELSKLKELDIIEAPEDVKKEEEIEEIKEGGESPQEDAETIEP